MGGRGSMGLASPWMRAPVPGGTGATVCACPAAAAVASRCLRRRAEERPARRPGRRCCLLAHQPLHRAASSRLTGPPQRLPRAPVAVGVVVLGVQLADWANKTLVLHRSPERLTLAALIVGGRRRAQGPADRLDPEAAALLVDVAAHFGRSGPSSRPKTGTRTSGSRWCAAARSSPCVAADLLALLAGQQSAAPARVGLRLAHLLAPRLRMHPEIVRNLSDRPVALQRQADASLDQLIRILLRLSRGRGGSPLPRTESSIRGLRQTRPGSTAS